jgi:hypothetical protein
MHFAAFYCQVFAPGGKTLDCVTNDPVHGIVSGKKSPVFGAFGSGNDIIKTGHNTPANAPLSSRNFNPITTVLVMS